MDHPTHMSAVSVVPMALSALLLAAVVPGVVHVLRRSALWERISVPAPVALPLLVLVHAWAVLGEAVGLPAAGGALVTEPALLAAAVLFWLPVAARTRHRLDDPGRCLYLFLATPLLDLPAVAVVAAGHSAQGLAMIVGMLPIGIAAAAVTWSWVNREEREARQEPGAREKREARQEPGAREKRGARDERESRGIALPAPEGDPLAP